MELEDECDVDDITAPGNRDFNAQPLAPVFTEKNQAELAGDSLFDRSMNIMDVDVDSFEPTDVEAA